VGVCVYVCVCEVGGGCKERGRDDKDGWGQEGLTCSTAFCRCAGKGLALGAVLAPFAASFLPPKIPHMVFVLRLRGSLQRIQPVPQGDENTAIRKEMDCGEAGNDRRRRKTKGYREAQGRVSSAPRKKGVKSKGRDRRRHAERSLCAHQPCVR